MNISNLTTWLSSEPAISAFIIGGLLLIIAAITTWLLFNASKNPTAVIKRALKPFKVLHHVTFTESEDRLTQLDYLVLTDKGIFLLSTLNATGQVFGGNKMTEWTVMGEHRRFRIPNPQDHLFDQLASLRTLNLKTPIAGYILFTSATTFSKGTPDYVIDIEDFAQQYRPIHDPEMLADWEKIEERTIPTQ